MEPFERKVRESFGRQAFMTTLGAEIDCVAPGRVEIRTLFNQEHTQQDGFTHAGVIASILDSACGYAAYSLAPEGCNVLTVEFKVNLLAPAVGKAFVARAQVKRGGKTLTVCAGDAFAINGRQEKLIATMLATIMTLPTSVSSRSV
jgi:uncharacterized protein (TIGR00369 family)